MPSIVAPFITLCMLYIEHVGVVVVISVKWRLISQKSAAGSGQDGTDKRDKTNRTDKTDRTGQDRARQTGQASQTGQAGQDRTGQDRTE